MLTIKTMKIFATGKSGLSGFQLGPGVIGDCQIHASIAIRSTHAETIAT